MGHTRGLLRAAATRDQGGLWTPLSQTLMRWMMGGRGGCWASLWQLPEGRGVVRRMPHWMTPRVAV